MVSAIIGGVLALGGALAGGIASAKANREAQVQIQSQKRKNRNWFDTEISKDYTQRADVQASLERMRSLYHERSKNLQGQQAVSGATEEAAAIEKEQANRAIADTTSNIAAQGAQYKDEVGREYRQMDTALTGQTIEAARQKAVNIANAVSGVSQAAGSIVASGAGASSEHKLPSLEERKAQTAALHEKTGNDIISKGRVLARGGQL